MRKHFVYVWFDHFVYQVAIDKFPAKKKFSIDMNEFAVEADAEVTLTISWSPEEVGGCREMVSLRSDQICRLQFIMIAMATNERMHPKKVGSVVCQT